jgi:hypothetical protein
VVGDDPPSAVERVSGGEVDAVQPRVGDGVDVGVVGNGCADQYGPRLWKNVLWSDAAILEAGANERPRQVLRRVEVNDAERSRRVPTAATNA